MEGRVRSDAEHFELPYDVLAGRDSEIIADYGIVKLPRVIVLDRDGVIAFTAQFAPYEKLNDELQRLLAR
jgi:hypothetical protein